MAKMIMREEGCISLGSMSALLVSAWLVSSLLPTGLRGAQEVTPSFVVVPIDTIGAAEGPEALTMPGVAKIARDGSLFVLFHMDKLVQRFGSTGELLERYGRSGQGPGEFTRPTGISVSGDSLWVFDGPRVSAFQIGAPDGSTVVPYRPSGVELTRGFTLMPAAQADGGRFLYAARFGSTRKRENELVEHPIALVDRRGEPLLDTVALLTRERETAVYKNPRDAVGVLRMQHPFPLSDLWAVQPATGGIVVVDRRKNRHTGTATLYSVDLAGDTLWTGRIRTTSSPRINPEELSTIERQHIEILMESRGAQPRSRAEAARWVREFFSDVRYRPPVSDLRVASDGLIWMQLPTPEEVDGKVADRDWLILSPSFETLGTVSLPAGQSFLDARGGRVLTRYQDHLGIPYLVLSDIRSR